MATTAGLVTLAYVQANFRPAVFDDFSVGLQYFLITPEKTGSTSNFYKITGFQTISNKITEEAIAFTENMKLGYIWIATSY